MKFSESWLREWVNPAVSSEELQEQITMAGLEVDDVAPAAAEFSGVIIGEVVECGQHPDADKLQVTKVNVGSDELLDIVCGAPNCRLGLKVAVAVVGAILPGNFKIKKAKLRGQPSMGMLCSYSELGISDDHDGIIEIAADATVGTNIREYMSLDDNCIEIDLTPNRADCLSIAGVAREVGVINKTKVTEPVWEIAETTIDDTYPVTVSAPDACPVYLGRVIKNVDVHAVTPLWMVEKLRRSGIRSIDPVVDITNYVLLEFGQPLHAFDLEKLGSSIDVRMATSQESITLLDESDVKLSDNTLVISDTSGAIALAGIFGGASTGVSLESSHIFLECAFFTPLAITGRARQYGLHTDASHRYERGVDYQLQYKAIERATQLIKDICGGEVGPITKAGDESLLPKAATIELRHARLEKVVGQSFEASLVLDILQRLGLEVTQTTLGWSCVAPSYRFDFAIEEDLIEEIARVFGYNNIPNVSPLARLKMFANPEANNPLSKLRQVLNTRGYQEAVTYSFVDPKRQTLLHPEQEAMILPHPISIEMSAMRLSLWTGLLDAVSNNQKRQQSRIRLFETGLRFVADENAENGVAQTPMIAGVICGSVNPESWNQEARNVDFFDAKGDVEALLDAAGQLHQFEFVAASNPALHPGQSAAIIKNGRVIGYLGGLHPSHYKAMSIQGPCFVFELEQSSLIERNIPSAKAVSKFPANRRDLAFIVDKSLASKDIINLAEKVGGNQLVGVNLFDVYQGKGVPADKKSIAIALTLQDVNQTLEEKEIAASVEKVVTAICSEFDASLRE